MAAGCAWLGGGGVCGGGVHGQEVVHVWGVLGQGT